MFFVSIKSNQDNEKDFFASLSIRDGMKEQDIYEIVSLRIANEVKVDKELLEQTYVCT